MNERDFFEIDELAAKAYYPLVRDGQAAVIVSVPSSVMMIDSSWLIPPVSGVPRTISTDIVYDVLRRHR